MDKALFSSEKTNWETPQELFDRLNAEFHFTLDAAADDLNHKLPHYYTLEANGLDQDWGGNVSFAILRTGTRTPACGLKNAGKKLRSQTLSSFFLFRRGQTANPFMTSSMKSQVLKFVS